MASMGIQSTLQTKLFLSLKSLYLFMSICFGAAVYWSFYFTPACLVPISIKAIEVLLKTRAFVVKRCGEVSNEEAASKQRPGQVTWSRYETVEEAWEEAKKRASFL